MAETVYTIGGRPVSKREFERWAATFGETVQSWNERRVQEERVYETRVSRSRSLDAMDANRNRDPGDENDHRHTFDPTTATCACGLTAEQLRTH